MDILFRQLRTKHPNVGQENKEGSRVVPKDRTIPPQKTQSFKGGDYQTAVAAAAFADKSLEESRTRDEKRAGLAKIKSNTEDTVPVPERRTRSIKFLDEVPKPNLDDLGRRLQKSTETSDKKPEKTFTRAPSIKKKLSFADTQPNRKASSQPESTLPTEKAIGPAPSIKKTPTFDKNLDKTISRKPEIEEPKLEIPAPIRPPFIPGDTTRQSPKNPGIGDRQAEAWENGEMTRIKEKYEKLRTTILDWENKKKTKAKRRLQRVEAELDKRRAKAMQQCRSNKERTESIAGGTRSKAEENRKNEEQKVKEKANKIRLTGKLPATCWCF